MSIADPAKCSWYPFIDEPLLESVRYASQFSSPQVIMPYDSCDGKWHMFFHSWIGIHHFVSDSGIAWEPRKVIEFYAHCPSIFKDGETYYLIYEKHDKRSRLSNQRRADVTGYNSRIEMKVSTDLITWSKSRLLLSSEDVSFASDYRNNARLSNPQLFKVDGGYRLYFGASTVKMADSDYKCPRYFGYAFSKDMLGPYLMYTDSLLLESDGDNKYSNLGTGSIRLVKAFDKFFGFQCGFYWDGQAKKTRSAIKILESEDGIRFKECKAKPVLTTSDSGWTSSYIGTCDVHYKADESCWYCYFSARGGKARKHEKESIGLMIGKAI